MNVGLVGAGNIAETHLETLDGMSDVDIVAIADVDRAKAAAEAIPRDAAVYTDGSKLIEDADLDALFIAVPPFAHGRYERLAAEREIDMFVEKPIGLSLEAVRETHELIERHDVVTQVGYVGRYADITERALDLLDDRRVALIDSQYWVEAPPASWWSEKTKSGGQLVEQSTHVFDLHRYFVGDVVQVAATGTEQAIVEGLEFEDATSVTMKHESGTVSHISSTSAASRNRFRVRLLAEQLELELDYFKHTITGVIDGESITYEGDDDWYVREVEAFLDAVRTGATSDVRSDYADAIETLLVTLYAQDSVDSGCAIDL